MFIISFAIPAIAKIALTAVGGVAVGGVVTAATLTHNCSKASRNSLSGRHPDCKPTPESQPTHTKSPLECNDMNESDGKLCHHE
jgi:hypothetical protein